MKTSDLDQWIEREFAGHGRALRRIDDTPLDGEPWMSMEDAKELTRRAVAEFSRSLKAKEAFTMRGLSIAIFPTSWAFGPWNKSHKWLFAIGPLRIVWHRNVRGDYRN